MKSLIVLRATPTPPSAGSNTFDLEALFREHHTFVWRVVRRLGVSDRSIDDAVQEVFVVMLRRRDELVQRSSVRGLLYGIARRVASRHRDTRRSTLSVLDPDNMPGCGRDAEQTLALDEAATVVREALASMDEDKRMTFLLADVEGMTMPEVADCMEVNLNTAYARLRSARLLLERAVARHRAREEGDRVRASR